MNNRVTFPDFSAFQIDIPHGTWPHEAPWSGDSRSDPDLYSAFWPEFRIRQEQEQESEPVSEQEPTATPAPER
ncbi:hypothetical protein HP499_06955 [Paenarthrobacter sp. CM16]|jgi:hypothetical protein|uniref:hypothetical protein n=1 Tax=Paenarthrobacter sp. CM16 TaxID=2738447 RepID=UPI001556FA96|nr:hypothetical protein [Paenarthrobacter sp. CM16]NQD87542.1 hypothetical protein [Paenarthrobacter sp. CM16]